MDEQDLWGDPVRHYMLPAHSERDAEWSSHPRSQRDSLHERDMWAVEGLTHRYPTKVLIETPTPRTFEPVRCLLRALRCSQPKRSAPCDKR